MLAGTVFAATASSIGSTVTGQLIELVKMLQGIVPVIALGLFVFAGIVYAVGQVFDVQTRNKAQNWAMAMIVGGIIGVLIVLIAPWLVDFLLGFSG
jgi:hypothetical protein